MHLKINSGNPLLGEISLPGDKSISHRAALLSALAEGRSTVENFLVSGVTNVMLDSLSGLGVRWSLNETRLCVEGEGMKKLRPIQEALYCGNSATTLRLLAGACVAADMAVTLDGSDGLRKRPMDRIIEPLTQMGAFLEAASGGNAPLHLHPSLSGLRGIEYIMPVASAQVKSAILLAGLGADGVTIIREAGPTRDHTERMLAHMGAFITTDQMVVILQSGVPLKPLEVAIPGDISSAAFLIVAALITPGSRITLKNVGLNPTRTGLLDALIQMGAGIKISNQTEADWEPAGDITVAYSELMPIEVSGDLVVRMIDEFPIFAIAAAHTEGVTKIREAGELRYKETDRIAVLARQLRAIGIDVTEQPDGFDIKGYGEIDGGEVDGSGDHRIAMSLAVAGLAAGAGVRVQDAGILRESFPEFLPILSSLGARFEELNEEPA